jgi:hypothetical protein
MWGEMMLPVELQRDFLTGIILMAALTNILGIRSVTIISISTNLDRKINKFDSICRANNFWRQRSISSNFSSSFPTTNTLNAV